MFLLAIPLVFLGSIGIKEKLAHEKAVRNDAIKNMKENLSEQLRRDKTARNEMLQNVKKD